jgi:CheY-like chemotaxis protein
VLLNLASNAIKFTEQGEVLLSARIESETETDVRVRLEVTDTGMGIDPGDHQRLFQAFSQVDASTTRRFGGSGLGLAISKQLVEVMGGQLSVVSAVGQGSTFAFTLPLTRGAADPSPSSFGGHQLQGTRVLVVDDNATNRLILREQLTAWDLQPQVAESGVQALRLLHTAAQENRPIGLALLDMNMPGMDGLELARRINQEPALRPIRLVLLTSGEARVADLQAAGVAVSLAKPVRSSQLYDSLVRTAGPALMAPHLKPPTVVAPDQAIRRRLLVVEDNGTNQLVARGLLTRLGYRVDIAANGREALEALDRTEYAAVLMDCQMPEMDGYTATGEIRRSETNGQHLPIIAMTAGALEGDQERCLAAGMDDYLAKPIKFADLETILDRWVSPEP